MCDCSCDGCGGGLGMFINNPVALIGSYAGAAAAGRVLYVNGAGIVSTEADFTYEDVGNVLGVSVIRNPATGTTLTLGTVADNDLIFRTNSATRWSVVGLTGHFVPGTDASYDIGSATLRARNAFLSGSVQWGTGAATDISLNREAAGVLGQRSSTQAQVWRVYNTYASGVAYEAFVVDWQSSANQCLIGTKHAGATQRALVIDGSSILFQTGGSSRWQVTGGGLIAVTDNTYDIGASLATRPRTVYVGTSVLIGPAEAGVVTPDLGVYKAGQAVLAVRDSTNNIEAAILAGTTQTFFGASSNHQLALITNNTARWAITTSGHLIGNVDNTYDIGASGATRPRTAYIGTSLDVVAGAVVLDTVGITMGDGKNIVVNTGTGTKIGTATTQKLGFFNSAPIAQPSSTGESTGFSAGAGTNVTDQSTFTGNVGSTAYRINDVVKHLKNLGLIAA